MKPSKLEITFTFKQPQPFEISSEAGVEKNGGMQLPQAFGSASTYARKVALCGLLGIDDSDEVDPDHNNKHEREPETGPSEEKKWVAVNDKSTKEALVIAWWDGSTILKTNEATPRPYVETNSSRVLISDKQYNALKVA